MKTKKEKFEALVLRFGRKSGSHLFPLWNYFFVPQTMAQFNRWRKSIENGMANQNLLFKEEDFLLVKDFCQEVEIKYTKSKMIRVINFSVFVEEIGNFIKNK